MFGQQLLRGLVLLLLSVQAFAWTPQATPRMAGRGMAKVAFGSPSVRMMAKTGGAGGATIIKPPARQLAPPKNEQKTGPGGGAKYKLLLFNDPMNTKEYVARILMTKCGLNEGSAFQCMMQAHQSGMGLIGIWMREVAEMHTKQCQEAGLSVEMVPNDD
mmetsp:Transcript_3424/g.7132  ORF Transcript_3424/g.7132 Transcript_3424/m.7132 type:complete len:159 (-) Transcript_3424:182-658(-)|eukprot:CAMPEP_0182570970 /NCGR_PEP_ID=MMETSP1324-20130603/11111_1 /TAXON_ID=236786 /ORGANISM="Florenciella sp., Strain RCC1587" /LENGTH=158 /DNA_ID=CAMNT_0024785417 /DNA_START=162 /DNA_END=638 /DNA_ORIENTATION=-